MARRVSWTNNSSGHLGAYVYRGQPLDPQALPAPLATVDPVAQGTTAEWIDNEELDAGDYDYAVQDYDGAGVSAVSAVEVHTVPLDISSAQIGDEVEGGIYVGTLAYADGRQFYIIFAKSDGHLGNRQFATESYVTGANDLDDGAYNTNILLTDTGAAVFAGAEHCGSYAGGGFDDWYLPAIRELRFLTDIYYSGHPEFQSVGEYSFHQSSSENGVTSLYVYRPDGAESSSYSKGGSYKVIPARRVAV